jgi:hypothetical protein
MGYILKNGGGAGTGDATAANQTQQINQLLDGTGVPSVFKNQNDVGIFSDNTPEGTFTDLGGRSVFKESNTSVFKNANGTSAFLTPSSNSILEKSKISEPSTLVQSFQNSTPALLALDIQNFLTPNSITIIAIVYADAGGVAPNPHTALIIYNPI